MVDLPSGGTAPVMAESPASIRSSSPLELMWRFYPQHTWSLKFFHLPCPMVREESH
jgi:hypothetical protein